MGSMALESNDVSFQLVLDWNPIDVLEWPAPFLFQKCDQSPWLCSVHFKLYDQAGNHWFWRLAKFSELPIKITYIYTVDR